MNKKNRLEERSEGKATIYVRVDPRIKNNFAEITKPGSEYSQGEVIEKLLEYFLKQPTDVRNSILGGNHIDPIKRFGELIEIQSWGDRALSAKKWIWALQEYKSLETKAGDAEGLKRYSWYKQAFCLHEIAASLRQEALLNDIKSEGNNWQKHFDLAQQALALSINYLTKMITNLDSGPDKSAKNSQHPIALFNVACCWSLRAQYLIEENLGAKLSLIRHTRNLSKDKQKQSSFNQIGQDIGKWRNLLSTHQNFKKISRDISQYAGEVMATLTRVGEDVNSSQGHTEWIIESAQADTDLAFIRLDEIWGDSFTTWLNNFGRTSLADSCESLLSQIGQK